MKLINRFKLIALTALLLLTVFSCASTEGSDVQDKTEVYLVGSIHFFLASNPNYSMDTLEQLISDIDPEVLAIEILPMDIDLSTEELNELYPPEFSAMRDRFLDEMSVVGFNWISDAQRYDRPTFFAQRSSMWADILEASTLSNVIEQMKTDDELIEEIVTTGTPSEVNSPRFDEILLHQQNLVQQIIDDQQRDDFYDFVGDLNPVRNANMEQELSEILSEHPGETIVVLTGAKHRTHLLPFFESEYPDIIVHGYID